MFKLDFVFVLGRFKMC